MDLRRLEYFLAVAEHGRVTSAAAALHIAQPSLSQAIRSLERDLGTKLFHRGGRGLTPTPAGRALIEPARRVLQDLAVARAAVASVAELTSGWLDLVAQDMLAMDPVAPALAAFHGSHPGVPVRIMQAPTEAEMMRMVVSGRCELAVTYLPMHHPGLLTVPLGAQAVWAVLPPGTPDVPDPLPVGYLDGMRLVDGVRGFESARATVRRALIAANVRMGPAVRSRHREAVIPLVLAGVGVAFMHRRYAGEAAQAGAVVRRLSPRLSWRIGLLHRDGDLSPEAAEFVTALADQTGTDGNETGQS